MTLLVLGFSDAEARNSSMISRYKVDRFRYFSFHLAQSVPGGALFASSTNGMSLIQRLALLSLKGCWVMECNLRLQSHV